MVHHSEFDKLIKRPLKDLERIADNYHSELVRRKFADHAGRVSCCTCPITVHWKNITCGHFVPRRHTQTRWLVKNAGPQCGTCNGPNQGESVKMVEWLDKTYGAGTAEEMIILGHKNYKTDRVVLVETIIQLKIEIDELES